MKNPREVAIRALIKIEQGAYSNLVLKQLLTPDISSRDRALITELVYGVIQNRQRIDYIISKFSTTKISKMSRWVLCALRLAIYQIIFLDRIPNFAAVSESVNIVKRHQGQKRANFVNAVLRNIVRNRDKISYPDVKRHPEEFISIYYSFPLWLVKRWIGLYGIDFTEKLCRAFNERPKMSIRVNTLKTDKATLKEKLSDESIFFLEGKFLEEALYLTQVPTITQISCFQEGLFQPQDEASMLVSRVAGVAPGEKVLDVAAAPGGKATHMAQLMENRGEIVAWDIYPHRVKLIKETCKRLGVSIVEAKVQDALEPVEKFYYSFDKVILDAPCSGLGVIRRKPDIKWTKTAEDIASLKKQQLTMLNQVCQYVKPGGVLIYSTCSIDEEENEEVIRKFLQVRKDFTLEDLTPYLPQKLKDEGNKGYIKLFPHLHEVDGFFIARLKRIPTEEM